MVVAPNWESGRLDKSALFSIFLSKNKYKSKRILQ